MIELANTTQMDSGRPMLKVEQGGVREQTNPGPDLRARASSCRLCNEVWADRSRQMERAEWWKGTAVLALVMMVCAWGIVIIQALVHAGILD